MGETGAGGYPDLTTEPVRAEVKKSCKYHHHEVVMACSDHISAPGLWNRRGTMWNFVELCGTFFFSHQSFIETRSGILPTCSANRKSRVELEINRRDVLCIL